MIMSPLIRRVAALGLLLALVLAVYTIVLAPIFAGYGETNTAISQSTEMLKRYRQIAAAHDSYKSKLSQLQAQQSEIGIYLGGSTDALAGAELQELVNRTVESGGGRLRSVQILPVKTDGKFRRITARVQMTATVAQIARVLYTLEAGSTYLFVENLEVNNRRARRRRNKQVEMDPVLLVRVDLSGYLRPEAG